MIFKKLTLALFCIFTILCLFPRPAYAQPITRGRLNITEEDLSPTIYPYQLRVTNGTLTDNADGTASLNTSGTGTTGWTKSGTDVHLTTPTDNVGIGELVPSGDKLYVSGDTGISGNLTVGGTTTLSSDLTLTGTINQNADLLLCQWSGKVGIGIANPLTKLHIDGEVGFKPRTPQPLVTFVFDDSNNTDYDIMKPVFDAQGEVACSAVVTDWINTPTYLNTAEMLELEAAGWEILSHSVSHANLTTLSEADLRVELEDSKAVLDGLGLTVYNFAYPYNTTNELVRRTTREYYRSGRGSLTESQNAKVINTFHLRVYTIDDHTKLSTYQGYVNTAESDSRWLILYLHSTDANDATTMSSLIDYIQAKGISIVTIDEGLDLIGNVIDIGDNFAAGEQGIRAGDVSITSDLTVDGTTLYVSSALNRVGIGTVTPNNTLQVNELIEFDNTDDNTKIGYQAGKYIVTGAYRNTFLGYRAGLSSIASSTNAADKNTAVGHEAFSKNETGSENTAVGSGALGNNDSGVQNNAIGRTALIGCTSGNYNNAMGFGALAALSTATGSCAVGRNALQAMNGSYCVGIGYNAGESRTGTPSYNTFIGARSGDSTAATSNCTHIGGHAGKYETAGNTLFIDGLDRTNEATGRTNSLIYGVMNATAASQVLSLGGGGNVGISTTAPSAKLDVVGSAQISQDLTIGSTSLYVMSGQNRVGIGTTSPTAGLQMGNDKLIALDTNAGITASVTQTQGQGALTAQVNEISTCATDDDTVTLPPASTGVAIEIINHGAETLQIFPASGDNLGKGVDIPEELEPNESVGYVAYTSTNWAKEATTEIIHAEMFDFDNTDPYVINAASEAHMYHTNGMQAGDLADWTFDVGGAGTSFAIASIADGTPSGQQAEITTTDNHGLAVGDIVSLTNMSAGTNTGTFIVRTPVADKTFEITSTNSTTATGTMDQAAVLIADTGSAGQYLMNWSASAAATGANDVFDFAIHVGATHINSTNIRRKFGGGGDVGAMSGVSIITITDGDRVSFMITNTSGSGNITMRDFALVLVRL